MLMQRSYRDVYVGGPEPGFVSGMDTSRHQRQWLTANDGSLVLNYPANQQWGAMFVTVGPAVPGSAFFARLECISLGGSRSARSS